MKSILCIALQGIGDLLLFLPAGKILHAGYPKAKLELLTLDGPSYEVSSAQTCFHRVYAWPRGGFWERLPLISSLRERKHDICLVSYPSLLRPHLLAHLTNTKHVVGHQYDLGLLGKRSFFCNITIKNSVCDHFLDRNLELVQATGVHISEADHRPVLLLSYDAIRYADEFIESRNLQIYNPIIGVHPGSGIGMMAKRWPQERYAALIRLLQKDLNAKIIVFAGPDDVEIANAIVAAAPEEIEFCSGGTFLETAAVIGRCHLFISNDSALMHAATALDVRTIALFGPTDPRQNGPYGPEHVVIRKPLHCSPCYRLTHHGVRCHDGYKCMRLIAVDEVLSQACHMLSVRRI